MRAANRPTHYRSNFMVPSSWHGFSGSWLFSGSPPFVPTWSSVAQSRVLGAAVVTRLHTSPSALVPLLPLVRARGKAELRKSAGLLTTALRAPPCTRPPPPTSSYFRTLFSPAPPAAISRTNEPAVRPERVLSGCPLLWIAHNPISCCSVHGATPSFLFEHTWVLARRSLCRGEAGGERWA